MTSVYSLVPDPIHVKYTNVLQLSRAVRIPHPVNNKTRLNAVMAGGDADDTGRRVFDVTSFQSRAADERDDTRFDGGGTRWPRGHVAVVNRWRRTSVARVHRVFMTIYSFGWACLPTVLNAELFLQRRGSRLQLRQSDGRCRLLLRIRSAVRLGRRRSLVRAAHSHSHQLTVHRYHAARDQGQVPQRHWQDVRWPRWTRCAVGRRGNWTAVHADL